MNENLPVATSLFIDEHKRVDLDSIDPVIVETLERFNHDYQADPAVFWARIEAALRPSGSRIHESSILFRQPGDSVKYCVASQPPFMTSLLPRDGNPNSYNIAVKTYLLDQVNRQQELWAPDGRKMSTLVVSGPDRNHWPLFSPLEFLKILRGDFSPYAQRITAKMKHHGFEAAYFYGVSRAAIVGASALKNASKDNVDGLGGVFVEPTDYENLRFWQPAVNFACEFAPGTKPENLDGHWWDDGPAAMLDLQAENGDGSALGNLIGPNKAASAIGFSHDKFLQDVRFLGLRGIPVAVGYGENSAMSARFPEIAVNDPVIPGLVIDELVRLLVARGPASSHGFTENHLAHASMISDGLNQIWRQKN